MQLRENRYIGYPGDKEVELYMKSGIFCAYKIALMHRKKRSVKWTLIYSS